MLITLLKSVIIQFSIYAFFDAHSLNALYCEYLKRLKTIVFIFIIPNGQHLSDIIDWDYEIV